MELPVQQLCKPEWSDKIGSGGYFVQLDGIAWPVETGFLVKNFFCFTTLGMLCVLQSTARTLLVHAFSFTADALNKVFT